MIINPGMHAGPSTSDPQRAMDMLQIVSPVLALEIHAGLGQESLPGKYCMLASSLRPRHLCVLHEHVYDNCPGC